ncbi:MAG: hypothetical protein FWG78_01385 [Coriobacteriia bacterium]|nr:hypothetical protein [Coriobacteriia bacterium]
MEDKKVPLGARPWVAPTALICSMMAFPPIMNDDYGLAVLFLVIAAPLCILVLREKKASKGARFAATMATVWTAILSMPFLSELAAILDTAIAG